jgi:choline dehydrogenase-like flavoprotein
MGTTDFDVVIVGSGAGGGVAAAVLAAKGLTVALVEKGRNAHPTIAAPELHGSLFGNDEIKRRRFFAFQDPFIEPRVFVGGAGAAPQTVDVQGLGVCVGGGTVQYDADSPRVVRADLRLLSTFGEVEGADVVDWPIAYEDLEPYYDLVEALVGVQGLAGADPHAEKRRDYPMPPGFPSKAGLVLSEGARALGYHPHPMPMAINSIAYRGRPACVNCGFCGVGCPVNAKGSTAVTAVRDALLTGKATLFAEHCVTEVLVDTSGARARGVACIDPKGESLVITGKHVVLAANAIETPRLLLASATSQHANGLGNSSGLVGRYLMFHLVFGAMGTFPYELRSYRGRTITHAMADFVVPDGSKGWVRGGYVELGGSIHPIEEGTSYPWQLHKALATDGQYRRRVGGATMMGEDVPVIDNRVTLDPDVRDVYGRPVARIAYARHWHDQAVVDHYMPKLKEIALASGAKDTIEIDFAGLYGAPQTRHLLGTTRMGTDPKKSVVDPLGKLHDAENVWVADGGVFPTSTAFNPTLTQQALAYRTADAITTALGAK